MIRPENIERFKSIKPKSARVGGSGEAQKPLAKVLRELKRNTQHIKNILNFIKSLDLKNQKIYHLHPNGY